MRSLLFVPADNQRKILKAADTAADAVVLDLEDSVLPDRKAFAREQVKDYFLSLSDHSRFWVRVNDLSSGELLRDLAATVALRPAGIVLPKIKGPEDVALVSNYLEALEASCGEVLPPTPILAVITETPAAVLRMGELIARPLPRLKAVTWGAEDLSSAIGAGDPRSETGAWRPMYDYVRTQCLLAGHAIGIDVIDTVFVNFRDSDALRRACEESRYDGFTGRVAIHPDQVPIINAAFTPTEDELALAHRIIAAFDAGAGAVSVDGKMYDIPHLKAARRIVAKSAIAH